MTQPTANDPRLGAVIDNRYTLVRRIGAGGTGVVYEAQQHAVGRMVAVKMLSAVAADDPEWVRRFRDEAMTCARLAHPNTIRVFDVGQTQEGALFMVMELLEGQSVRQALRQGAMSPARVLQILLQICASLAEAHGLGIVHRDIKADNVFLLQMGGATDYVKVLDFSVAKLLHDGAIKTRVGMVLGTPQYMSPEQCRGLPLDPRSDLYSVGILAYEMANGRLPFTSSDPREVLSMQLRDPVPAFEASVPAPLIELISCALQKDPVHRFSHAGAMMRACEEALDQLQQPGIMVAPQVLAGAPNERPSAPRLGPAQRTILVDAAADQRPPAPPAALPDPRAQTTSPGGYEPPPTVLPPSAKTLVVSPDRGALPIAGSHLPSYPPQQARPHTEIMPAPATTDSAHADSQAPHALAPRSRRDGMLLVALGISIGIIAFVAVRLFLAL